MVAQLPHVRAAVLEVVVRHSHHRHAGGLGGLAGGQGVVEEDALSWLHPQQLRRVAEGGGGVLLHPQLLGVEDPLEVGGQTVAVQGRLAVLGDAGGEQDHPPPGDPTPVQVLPDVGLQGHVAVGVLHQIHPLGDDGLTGLLQVEVVPGELGAFVQGGVGHALVVFSCVRGVPPGQEGLVHLHPDAVGVDEGAVQIKNQHGVLLWLFSRSRTARGSRWPPRRSRCRCACRCGRGGCPGEGGGPAPEYPPPDTGPRCPEAGC